MSHTCDYYETYSYIWHHRENYHVWTHPVTFIHTCTCACMWHSWFIYVIIMRLIYICVITYETYSYMWHCRETFWYVWHHRKTHSYMWHHGEFVRVIHICVIRETHSYMWLLWDLFIYVTSQRDLSIDVTSQRVRGTYSYIWHHREFLRVIHTVTIRRLIHIYCNYS